MARPGVSYEDVAQAAQELLAEGKDPGVRLIRGLIGKGSPNSIHNHLITWRAENVRKPLKTILLPETLQKILISFMQDCQAQVRKELEPEINRALEDNQVLANDGASLEGEIAVLKDQLSLLTTDRDQAIALATVRLTEIDRLTQHLIHEQDALNTLRINNGKLEENLKSTQANLDKANQLNITLQEDLQAIENDRQMAKQEFAVASTTLSMTQRRNAELKEEVDALKLELKELIKGVRV